MAQLAYNLNPPTARAGMLYDSSSQTDIVSRVNATVSMPFGAFVVKDIGDDNVKLPALTAGASSVIEGVVVYTQDTQSGLVGDGVVPGVEAGKVISILQKGRIWVYCETAFNPDTDTVFVRFTANGALVPGNVRNDADGGKADQLGLTGYAVPYKALNTLTGAGFLALDLNIPAVVR